MRLGTPCCAYVTPFPIHHYPLWRSSTQFSLRLLNMRWIIHFKFFPKPFGVFERRNLYKSTLSLVDGGWRESPPRLLEWYVRPSGPRGQHLVHTRGGISLWQGNASSRRWPTFLLERTFASSPSYVPEMSQYFVIHLPRTIRFLLHKPSGHLICLGYSMQIVMRILF